MQVALLPGHYSISQYNPSFIAGIRPKNSYFYSDTRTQEEFSVVCETEATPEGFLNTNADWRCLRVVGTLDFSAIGLLASIAKPLADAKIGLVALSTFDTDYFLVKRSDLEKTRTALTLSGIGWLEE